jgi:hypothetical protein
MHEAGLKRPGRYLLLIPRRPSMTHLKSFARATLVALALAGLTVGTFASLQPTEVVMAGSSGKPGHYDAG